MFDYRYHALSLAAVLLALAVGVLIGVAIGDSNLVSSAKNGVVHDLRSEVSGANRQVAQLHSQLSTQEELGNDLYQIAVHGLLNGRRVGLVFLGSSSDKLDGLVRAPRFDLVLRSHEPFDPAMKAEIGTLFHNALEGSGLSGDVAFVNTAQFPVSPLSTIRPRLGIHI